MSDTRIHSDQQKELFEKFTILLSEIDPKTSRQVTEDGDVSIEDIGKVLEGPNGYQPKDIHTYQQLKKLVWEYLPKGLSVFKHFPFSVDLEKAVISEIDESLIKGDLERARELFKTVFDRAKNGDRRSQGILDAMLGENAIWKERHLGCFSPDRIKKLGEEFFKGIIKEFMEDFPIIGTTVQSAAATERMRFIAGLVDQLSHLGMSDMIVDAALETFQKMNFIKQQGALILAGRESEKLKEQLERAKEKKLTPEERRDFIGALPRLTELMYPFHYYDLVTDKNGRHFKISGKKLYSIIKDLQNHPKATEGCITFFKYVLDPAKLYTLKVLLRSDLLDTLEQRFGRNSVEEALQFVWGQPIYEKTDEKTIKNIEEEVKKNKVILILGKGLPLQARENNSKYTDRLEALFNAHQL